MTEPEGAHELGEPPSLDPEALSAPTPAPESTIAPVVVSAPDAPPSQATPLAPEATPAEVSTRADADADADAPPSRAPAWPPSKRTVALSLAMGALLAIIGINTFLILAALEARAPKLAAERLDADAIAARIVRAHEPAQAPPAAEPEPSATAAPAPDDADKPKAPERFSTVHEASARSCSTSSVEGLSLQIIAQSRCVDPRAFTQVPPRPNLVTNSHVFLFMDAAARDHLLAALDANKNQRMTVNSALRTVAQQYLLSRWARSNRCNIELATLPGESNHESGRALDIAEYAAWRRPLEAHGFAWLGQVDKVHFDYKGPGASRRGNVDVVAFQQLWNRNHPDDAIPENGRYSPAVEARLKTAPAGGFALGASCEAPRAGATASRPKPR